MCSLKGQPQAASPSKNFQGYWQFLKVDLPFNFLFSHDPAPPSETFRQTNCYLVWYLHVFLQGRIMFDRSRSLSGPSQLQLITICRFLFVVDRCDRQFC